MGIAYSGAYCSALAIAAPFAKPLSRPKIGSAVALPLAAIVPVLLIIARDTSVSFVFQDILGIDVSRKRIFAWGFALCNSLFLILSALGIAFGHRFRALAPFREETA